MKLPCKYRKIIAALGMMLIITAYNAESARIKDIANIEGVSGTQVIGYGLVTGLNNTGDNQRATFTVQSVSNMLKRFGLTVPQSNPRIKNVAAVMVTATIPPFLRKGSKVDIQVSSIGDASSLQGGVLIMTPLSGSEGSIIGMAQGPVSVGGYDFRSLGARVGRNFVTAGRVPNGLILEREMPGQYLDGRIVRIVLREPDFTTATRIAQAVGNLGGLITSATPTDAATVEVELSAVNDRLQVMQAITSIEALQVTTDPVARVVINERTGTVVVGSNVQLLPSVIAHGSLEISIQKQVLIPQQAPFTTTPPAPVATANVQATEELNPAVVLETQGPTVQDMATALNMLKVSARDLIAIFQALKESGSLQGDLIIQ